MDYRHLHLVAEICRCGSFGKAAQKLGVSQPALSKNIARLEDQLGVTLFARGEGATQPTVFALHILSRSQQMLSTAERIAIEVRQMATSETGQLRIGAQSLARVGFLPGLIGEIVETFPQLQIEILDRHDADIVASLFAREIDIGLTNDASSLPDGIVEFFVFSSPTIAVGRRDHPMLAKNTTTANDYPRVLLNTIDDPASDFELRAGGIAGPAEMVKEIVVRSDAITTGPAFLFASDIAAGRLVRVPMRLPGRYQCHALSTPGALHSRVLRKIVEMAQTRGSVLERSLETKRSVRR